MSILCRLGLHRWSRWDLLHRWCTRCRHVEYTEIGRRFFGLENNQ